MVGDIAPLGQASEHLSAATQFAFSVPISGTVWVHIRHSTMNISCGNMSTTVDVFLTIGLFGLLVSNAHGFQPGEF